RITYALSHSCFTPHPRARFWRRGITLRHASTQLEYLVDARGVRHVLARWCCRTKNTGIKCNAPRTWNLSFDSQPARYMGIASSDAGESIRCRSFFHWRSEFSQSSLCSPGPLEDDH